MTVADLILVLQNRPQDLPVAYQKFSEFCLLTAEDIVVDELRLPRPDGWVGHKRPDQPSQKYLVFPGN